MRWLCMRPTSPVIVKELSLQNDFYAAKKEREF
jgi:hypothetical protein